MSQMVRAYTVGEIPFDQTYAFLDCDGASIDITGWTAEQRTTKPDGTEIVHAATVTDGVNGVVTTPWVSAMTDTVGVYTAHVWVEESPYKLASTQIVWVVRTTN